VLQNWLTSFLHDVLFIFYGKHPYQNIYVFPYLYFIGNIRLKKGQELKYDEQHNHILAVEAVDCQNRTSKPVMVNIQVYKKCDLGWKGLYPIIKMQMSECPQPMQNHITFIWTDDDIICTHFLKNDSMDRKILEKWCSCWLSEQCSRVGPTTRFFLAKCYNEAVANCEGNLATIFLLKLW
jgi:hypothetical protein